MSQKPPRGCEKCEVFPFSWQFSKPILEENIWKFAQVEFIIVFSVSTYFLKFWAKHKKSLWAKNDRATSRGYSSYIRERINLFERPHCIPQLWLSCHSYIFSRMFRRWAWYSSTETYSSGVMIYEFKLRGSCMLSTSILWLFLPLFTQCSILVFVRVILAEF